MSSLFKTILILLSIMSIGSAFADQRAVFSSRATQGFAWSGSSQIIREKIAITVQPDHLDVEHELEIDAQTFGSWSTPNYPNALEIVGQLTMEKATVFTGLLLWNGDVILKGKLQTKEMARQKYEEVVDRNVTNPPPPRDPALLEYTGENGEGQNTYNLSIFPVTLGMSRKLRLRYLIPTAFYDGAQRCHFPHAFSRLAKVTIRGGEGIQGYAVTSKRADLRTTTLKLEQDIGNPIELESTAYQAFQPFNSWSSSSAYYLQFITSLFSNFQGSQVFIGEVNNHRGVRGQAAHFVFRPPQELLSDMPGTDMRLLAWVRSENDSAGKEVALNGLEKSGLQDLRIFSTATLEDSITWRLYRGDQVMREIIEIPRMVRMEDGNQFLRTFGLIAFYPMAQSMPKSLAAAWGFIDSKYALLALEQDSIPSDLARQFITAGVPTLDTSDIYPEDGSLVDLPLSAWLLQRNLDREELLKPTSLAKTLAWPQGIRWVIRDGALHIEIDASMRTKDLRVSLHDLSGKQVHQWDTNALTSGRISWKPQTGAAGTNLLRVATGAKAWTARVVLR